MQYFKRMTRQLSHIPAHFSQRAHANKITSDHSPCILLLSPQQTISDDIVSILGRSLAAPSPLRAQAHFVLDAWLDAASSLRVGEPPRVAQVALLAGSLLLRCASRRRGARGGGRRRGAGRPRSPGHGRGGGGRGGPPLSRGGVRRARGGAGQVGVERRGRPGKG